MPGVRLLYRLYRVIRRNENNNRATERNEKKKTTTITSEIRKALRKRLHACDRDIAPDISGR